MHIYRYGRWCSPYNRPLCNTKVSWNRADENPVAILFCVIFINLAFLNAELSSQTIILLSLFESPGIVVFHVHQSDPLSRNQVQLNLALKYYIYWLKRLSKTRPPTKVSLRSMRKTKIRLSVSIWLSCSINTNAMCWITLDSNGRV